MKTKLNPTAIAVIPLLLLVGYCFGGMFGVGVTAVVIIAIQVI